MQRNYSIFNQLATEINFILIKRNQRHVIVKSRRTEGRDERRWNASVCGSEKRNRTIESREFIEQHRVAVFGVSSSTDVQWNHSCEDTYHAYAGWLSRDERRRKRVKTARSISGKGAANRTTPLYLIDHSRNFFLSLASSFFIVSSVFYRCIFVFLSFEHASRLFRIWSTSHSVFKLKGYWRVCLVSTCYEKKLVHKIRFSRRV